jgi:selenophosphate synthase
VQRRARCPPEHCNGRGESLAAEGVTGLLRKLFSPHAAREETGRTMAAPKRSAVEAMEGFEVHSATDVTGYGLLGHLHEMMEASATTAQFGFDAIPLLSEARRFAAKGSRRVAPASTCGICVRGRRSDPASVERLPAPLRRALLEGFSGVR